MSRRGNVIDAPALNDSIVLQTVTYAKNTIGEQGAGTWADDSTMAADVEYGRSKEHDPENGKPFTTQKVTVRMHYRSDVETTWRIKHNVGGTDRFYQINRINNPGEQNLLTELACTWKVN